MLSPLISPTDLAARLGEPDWLIVDCRFELTNPTAGEAAYRASHIPGAVYAHLDRDLSSPRTPKSGRHPLPDADKFAATLGAWGVGDATQVVAYDADNSAYAARLWWLLHWIGHRRIMVLDGGYKAWREAGLPTTTDLPQRTATTFVGQPDRSLWLAADEVLERVRKPEWRLLDARAPERFAGEVEPLDPVAGHVSGARNHPFTSSLDANARFLPAAQLRERFAAATTGVDGAHTIAMCGSGVTACHLLLAMQVAGIHGARLYPGSWSEWITDPSRPVSKGRSNPLSA